MEIEYIEEPKIEFGDSFLCDDPKKGLTVGGFYSKSNNSHKSEIHFSCIGTKKDIERIIDWINELKNPIEATKKILLKSEPEIEDGEVKETMEEEEEYNLQEDELTYEYSKQINPDFPGFNKETVFNCEFLNHPSNNYAIKSTDIETILKSKDTKTEKLEKVISLYLAAYSQLEELYQTKPDICFLIIPDNIFNKLGSISFGKQFINLRRKLKAKIMSFSKNSIPVQLMLESTVKGKTKGKQDVSMIAWNFTVAQYYKTASCIPWVLTDIDENSCYIGISFHKILNAKNDKLRSSIAQAFNREGQGLIISGKQFEWNSKETKVSAPHLSYRYAKDLIQKVIKTYINHNGHTPKRIVVHKTTQFWDYVENEDYAEANGIVDGVQELLGMDIEVDLVSIRSTKIKLLRSNGKYPVMRGTLLKINDYSGVLYTTGYVPYYRTFPGVHVPMGLKIDLIGEATLRQIAYEILALSKLNFNNCNYYDSLPITLSFSQKVGEIIQYLPEDIEPPNRYYYYM